MGTATATGMFCLNLGYAEIVEYKFKGHTECSGQGLLTEASTKVTQKKSERYVLIDNDLPTNVTAEWMVTNWTGLLNVLRSLQN